MNLINIFLFYSIFGNIFETITMYFIDKSYISGIMTSIFTPIYGIAMLFILFVNKKINIKNKLIKIILEFIIFSILLGSLEIVGGVLIEKVFNKVYWNYDNYKYNIGIYTSLETSLLWGLMSIIILYLIHPIYKKLENYIPKYLTLIFSTIFIINLVYVLIVK